MLYSHILLAFDWLQCVILLTGLFSDLQRFWRNTGVHTFCAKIHTGTVDVDITHADKKNLAIATPNQHQL